MSTTPATTVQRPVLRGLLERFLRKHLIIGFGLSLVGALAWKFGVMDVKQRKTKQFWSTYNPDEDFERMRQLGVFHSARPDAGFEGMDLSGINLSKK